jgi:hypothetical protein
MAAVAHNPDFARRVGVPQSVGREFHEADKRKKVVAALMARKHRRA